VSWRLVDNAKHEFYDFAECARTVRPHTSPRVRGVRGRLCCHGGLRGHARWSRGRSIGRGLREFRKAQDEVQRSIRLSLDEEPPSVPMKGVAAPAEGGKEASDAAPPSEPPAPQDETRPAGSPESGAE